MLIKMNIVILLLKSTFFLSVLTIQFNSINKSERISVPKYSDDIYLQPKVIIAFLIRNKAHSLPYFLGNLERLNYTKSRIGLFIRLDHCQDNSAEIIEKWLNKTSHQYHSVNYHIGNNDPYEDEKKISSWSKQRYENIMRLKEESLNYARLSWADYLFMVDADVMVVNENILHHLMENSLPIIAPLIKCTNSEPYSNFWGDITDAGYYKRSEDYFDIKERNKTGIFPVPVVLSIYLINLNIASTLKLSFLKPNNSKIPTDDLIVFSQSAKQTNSTMFIDNRNLYGYFSSPVEVDYLEHEIEMFEHLKFQVMLDLEDLTEMFTLKPSKYLPEVLPQKSKLGFDEIYMINLKRRTDRYKRMMYLFDQLGIDAKYFEAIDGRNMTMDFINQMGIKQLPDYADPYHNRNIKMGEIGCFLSHYYIWEEMIKKDYEIILVFEDDIRFSPGFHRGLEIVLEDANNQRPDWELLYIGRKRMSKEEKFVEKYSSIVYPDYTYWTLGYILKKSGAQKLLAQQPLKKMVAVDEFLPIMFDRHPETKWKEKFEPRNLVAISAEPLLVEPTHYVGEPNHFSDTEDSSIIS